MANNTLTRKIYGSSTATTNDLAHIDIGYRCRVIGILAMLSASVQSSNDRVVMQISVASVGSVAVNDPQGVLVEHASSFVYSTSGGANCSASNFVDNLAIILPAGTRVYLHTVQTGTSATICTAILYLEPF